jgi:uncharacterized protein (DUF1501 family)
MVHAVGSPDATRSHFDAQDFMESGTPGIKGTPDGWLNRYLSADPREGATSFRAVAMSSQLPRVLQGRAPALAVPDASRFGLEARRGEAFIRRGLEALYAGSGDPLLAAPALETFQAIDLLRQADPARYEPDEGAAYPRAEPGRSLLQVAQLIKAGVGLEIAFVEGGGWDHHVNEGGARGLLANQLRPFGRALAAFARDLGDRLEDVVLVTLTEFGRTAAENGNRGTDHGHASVMLLMGGTVKGGAVHGPWPGLDRERLFEGRDLALTTDFRDVLAEVLTVHLGAGDLGPVFPRHPIESGRFRGVMKAPARKVA